MTTPDHIFVTPAWARTFDEKTDPVEREYVRRDPAVLAELPEVRALVRQAVDKAVRIVMDEVGYEEDDLCPNCRAALAAIREGRNG